MKRALILIIVLSTLLILTPLPSPSKAEPIVKQPVTELSLPAKIMINKNMFLGNISQLLESKPIAFWGKTDLYYTRGIIHRIPKNDTWLLILNVTKVFKQTDIMVRNFRDSYWYNITIAEEGKYTYEFGSDYITKIEADYYVEVYVKDDFALAGDIIIYQIERYEVSLNFTLFADEMLEALDNITADILINTLTAIKITLNNETVARNISITQLEPEKNYTITLTNEKEAFNASLYIMATAHYVVNHPKIEINVSPSENVTVNTTIIFNIKIKKGTFDIAWRQFLLWFNSSLIYNTPIFNNNMEISYTPRSKGIIKFLVLVRDIYGFNTTVSGELYIEVEPQVRVTSIDLGTVAMIGGGLGGLALLYLVAKELRKRELGGEELVISQ